MLGMPVESAKPTKRLFLSLASSIEATRRKLELINVFDRSRRISTRKNGDGSASFGIPILDCGDQMMVDFIETEGKGEGWTVEGDSGKLDTGTHRTLPGTTSLSQRLFHELDDFLLRLSCNDHVRPLTRDSIPHKWELYDDFCLLSEGSFDSPYWNETFKLLSNSNCQDLFRLVANVFKVSHLAVRSRINKSDILRKPHLKILYGSFKPLFSESPLNESQKLASSTIDFASTFFTSVKQLDVTYVWAPQHTMFSQGNISEKIRLSKFACQGEIVLDCYAGIGYWAFLYLIWGKAKTVMACELNPWSVEGMRRGAKINGIRYKVVEPLNGEILDRGDAKKIRRGKLPALETISIVKNPNGDDDAESGLVVYPGNNLLSIPHARNKCHRVNLGLLPTSNQAYPIAIEALHSHGGYIHVHVNLMDAQIPQWSAETIHHFEAELWKVKGNKWDVSVKHVEKVKSFAPRVFHFVFDLYCSPCILPATVENKHT